MIEYERQGDFSILRLTEELDYHGVQDLSEALDGVDENDTPQLIVSLSSGSFDDGAVGVLVRAASRLREAGGSLTLCGADAKSAESLRAIGVDRVVHLAESVESAVAARA